MDKKISAAFFTEIPFIFLNGGGFTHMMDDWAI